MPVIKMDMICNWRLTDGKVRFLSVPFANDEEYNMIVNYLMECQKHLANDINDNIKDLNT